MNIIPTKPRRICALPHLVLSPLFLAVVLSLLWPSASQAMYWDGNGATDGAGSAPSGTWGVDPFWNTDGNGTNATTAWVPGSIAIFSAGTNATGTFTVNVSGTQTVGFMSVEEGNVTFSGGSIFFNNGVFNVSTNATATAYTVLVTTNGLNKDSGGGILILAATNSYTGPTQVHEGFMRLGAPDVIPDLSPLSVSNNPNPATFDLNGYNETVGSLSANGKITLGAGRLTVGADNTPQTFSGIISGAGGLTKSGTGTQTLSGANSYTGQTIVSGGGLTLGASGVIADTSSILVNGGTLNLGTFSETVGPVTLSSGSIVSSAGSGVFTCGTVDVTTGTMTPNKMVCGTINLNGGTLATGGTGNGFGINCSGGLNINGGTATLAAGGVFANDVTLNSGTLIIGTTNVVGTGTLWLNGGNVQLLNSTARTVTNPVSIGGDISFNVPGSSTFSGPVTLTGQRTLTVNNTNTISGSIGENAAGRGLTKLGAGTLVLTGAANSYSGPTTNSAGIIQVNATSTLGNGAGNLVLNGGTLLSSAARTVATANPVILTADSTVATTSTSTSANFEFSGSIGGSAGTLSFVNNSASTGTFKPRFSGSGFNFSRPIVMTPGQLSFVQLNFFNTNSTDQTLSGVISGDGSLNRSASSSGTGGRTILSAANLYTGTTTINDGTLQIANTGALGGVGTNYTVTAGPGTTINANGILDLNGLALSEDITLTGGQVLDVSVAPATLNAPDGAVKAVTFSAGGSGVSGDATVLLSGGGGSGAAATLSVGVTASSFTIDNGGIYTSAPPATISAPSAGLTATATAVFVKNAGSNYTSAPTVTFNGGGGSNANFTALISSAGVVTNFVKVSGGSNYTSAPTITLDNGGGSGATAIAAMSGGAVTSVALSGPVTGVTITAPGSGYTTAPTIVFNAPPTNGVQALATGNSNQFTVVSITTTAPGSGYVSAPTVSLSSGTGFSGRATLSSGINLTNTGSIGGTGDITVNALITGTGSLNKVGSDTVTLNNTRSDYSGGTLVNGGVLKINNASGSATGTGAVTVTNGTLAGTGIITGPLIVAGSGTLSPGASIGTLTVSNDVTLTGNTFIEVDKTSHTCDKVIGINTLNYGGALTITNSSGTLVIGDSFPVFSATNYTGSFASITPPPGPGLAWSVNGGTLSVVQAPPTLNFSQTGNSLSFSWTGAYKLQAQTNLLTVGITTNWFDYNPNGNVSPVNVTINPANQTVFYRLISQ
jgi:autotransporter-associated beta strand protein